MFRGWIEHIGHLHLALAAGNDSHLPAFICAFVCLASLHWPATARLQPRDPPRSRVPKPARARRRPRRLPRRRLRPGAARLRRRRQCQQTLSPRERPTRRRPPAKCVVYWRMRALLREAGEPVGCGVERLAQKKRRVFSCIHWFILWGLCRGRTHCPELHPNGSPAPRAQRCCPDCGAFVCADCFPTHHRRLRALSAAPAPAPNVCASVCSSTHRAQRAKSRVSQECAPSLLSPSHGGPGTSRAVTSRGTLRIPPGGVERGEMHSEVITRDRMTLGRGGAERGHPRRRAGCAWTAVSQIVYPPKRLFLPLPSAGCRPSVWRPSSFFVVNCTYSRRLFPRPPLARTLSSVLLDVVRAACCCGALLPLVANGYFVFSVDILCH